MTLCDFAENSQGYFHAEAIELFEAKTTATKTSSASQADPRAPSPGPFCFSRGAQMKKPSRAKATPAKTKPKTTLRPAAKKSAAKRSKPKSSKDDEEATTETFLYVFGAPDGGKPRGARFLTSQFAQIRDAVNELKLAMCSDTSPRLTELGGKLPQGRVYARGKAFIPFIKKELLDQLRDAQYGPSTAPAGQEIPKDKVDLPDGPMTWDEVKVGDLVIAHQNHIEGWWEARVVERDGSYLTLAWLDYPEEGQFRREIISIALRHPGPIKSPY